LGCLFPELLASILDIAKVWAARWAEQFTWMAGIFHTQSIQAWDRIRVFSVHMQRLRWCILIWRNGVRAEWHLLKEPLIKSVIPAKAGIHSLKDQRVTGSPTARG
jgi:hypothetical protein